MLTNLERITRGIIPRDSFLKRLPGTSLAICITERQNKKFCCRLMDLETDWIVVLYASVDAETLGNTIERVMLHEKLEA